MDEMINKDIVKKLRSEKCWSQEHLSLVSGLSLRTIQRVENEGKCSLDSKKAIASAFDIDVKFLTASNVVVLSSSDHRLVAALNWLSLVDSGEYESSWQNTAKLFQSRIGCVDWVEKLKAVREPLGKNISRGTKNCTDHESLPGAPDGAYAVLDFDSVYEQKRNSLEKVTLEKSEAGWRVVGYFIQ